MLNGLFSLFASKKRKLISSEDARQDSDAFIKIPCDGCVYEYKPSKKDTANHNIAFFEHGVLVNVSPRNTAVSLDEDRDVAYQARYIVSDGVKYDLCNPEDVMKFQIPVFDSQTDGMFINVTRDLSYIMKIIAQQVYQKEVAIPLVFTTVNLMLASPIAWTDKDYERMISQLERLEEYQFANALRDGINRIKPEIYDKDLFDSLIMNKTLQLAQSFENDLVEMPYQGCACEECAKYQGRVYSISGSDKRYPRLPDFIKKTGKVHPGCTHILHNYFGAGIITKHVTNESGEVMTIQLDAITNSNRPFIDDRPPLEKARYEEWKKRQDTKKEPWDEESKRKYAQRRIEYEWIAEHLSDLAPKSLNAYTRMKRIRSEKYLQIKIEAEKLGIVLDDDL